MSYLDVELSPAAVVNPSRGSMPPGALTYNQFVSLVAKSLVEMGYATPGGGSGSGVDPVPLIEEHRVDTTNVHGVADTSALVLTGDARLSNARTPVAHTHPSSDVVNLISDLASKAPVSHSHALDLTPTWLNLALTPNFEPYPNTFHNTVDVCVLGGHLVFFRGVINILTSSSNGTTVFTLPSPAVPAPLAVRRLSPQSSSNDVVGLNVWPDRSVKVASDVSAGGFIVMDDKAFVTP